MTVAQLNVLDQTQVESLTAAQVTSDGTATGTLIDLTGVTTMGLAGWLDGIVPGSSYA
ncbi:hypothetical protein D3C78_1855400 [compost metagenome]